MNHTTKAMFPQRFALALQFQNVNISTFALAAGVSRMTAHTWRAGKSLPSIKRLATIAEVLGVTQAYLIGDDQPPEVPAGFKRQLRLLLAESSSSAADVRDKLDDLFEYVRFLRARTRKL